MVLENLVVYLLDKYLGDYIENLDTKKLKIDLWSGKRHSLCRERERDGRLSRQCRSGESLFEIQCSGQCLLFFWGGEECSF